MIDAILRATDLCANHSYGNSENYFKISVEITAKSWLSFLTRFVFKIPYNGAGDLGEPVG